MSNSRLYHCGDTKSIRTVQKSERPLSDEPMTRQVFFIYLLAAMAGSAAARNSLTVAAVLAQPLPETP
jgi:hypothetical protein